MEGVVRDAHWCFTTKYIHYNDSNGNIWSYIIGLEFELLKVVYEQMSMTFVHVATPERFEFEEGSVINLILLYLQRKFI
jgi:hypothetical protein